MSPNKPERDQHAPDSPGVPGIGPFLRRIPRQERARAVVDAILAAAEERLDHADGPLKPLLLRAGVAAGSFYEYFASRESLLTAVVERVTDRNFSTFLADTVAVLDRAPTLEQGIRDSAGLIARRYCERLPQLRSIIRIADRLGLLPYVYRERERFAAALSDHTMRFTPDMPRAEHEAMVRAVADALTGLVVVSAYRSPEAPLAEIERAAGDVAWGVVLVHLGRAGGAGDQATRGR
ncbi:MAG: TetR/AcrR family transcriptional regulator [Minicystis sp.]